MNTDSKQPPFQSETEYTGEVQVFSEPALAPDDPSLEPRDRTGRPANRYPFLPTPNMKTDSRPNDAAS